MLKVYISSRYSDGDPEENVKLQINVGNVLIDNGFNPFVPLLTHYMHVSQPRPYNYWLGALIEWLKLCDCVLRLPGESSGADIEETIAKKLNIPVFYSVDELLKHYKS